MKKTMTVVGTLALSLVLAACGNKITTSKTNYPQQGLVAVVKGAVSGSDTVHYSTATTNGSVKATSGTYAITLPVTDKQQTVTVRAAGQKATTHVAAATTLGTYKTVAAKYNQAIIGMALPVDIQKALKNAKQPTAAQIAAMTATQKMAMAKQQATLKQAMATATAATKDAQLPATAQNGIHQLLKTDTVTVRANVAAGKLVGYAVIVPIKAVKDKAKAKEFGTTLALLGSTVGADAQKVMKKFSAEMKAEKSSQTTMDTIKSNGVKYDVGYSTTNLYIYITK